MADGEARLRHPLLLDFAEGIDEDGQLLELEESSVQGADGDHDSYHHRKLLEAISHIDGRDSHAVVERSGFTGKPSEFYLQGLDEKLEIADLLPSKNTGGRALQDLKKKLKKLVDAENTLATPTPQHEVQKACRAATYIKAKQVVDKWLPAVLQGRREVSLVLPRGNWNMTKDLARPLHDVTRGSKTPLEQEVWTLLHGTSTPAPFSEAAPVLSRAMCIEEARARRIELQKYRALQSYFEAKARRQHKIKSKTYHRIQKRGRMKDESKQLEKLVNSNDQSAVDKHFQLLDIARIKERMTLRHKNTGKWAKAQALIAKYDPKARAELHEQLMRSKELNRKRLTTTLLDDGSDDEIQSVDEEAKPCNIGSLTNPWMHMSVQFESCATLVGKDKKKEGSEVAEDMKDNEEVVKIDDDDDDDAFENEQTLCKLQVGSSPRFSQEGQKVFSKEPGNDFEGTEYCEVLFSSCDGNLDASETISKNDGIKPTMKLSKQIGKQNQTINNEVQSKTGKRKRKKCKNKMKSVAKNSVKMSVKSDEHVCLKKREENMVPLDLMEMTTETRGTNCKKKQKTKNAVLIPEQHNKRSDLPIPPSVVSDNVNGKKHDEVHLAFHKLEIVTNKKGNNQIKTAKRTKTTKEKSRRQLNNKKATVEVMERTMKEDHAFSDNLDGEHSVITHADNIDPGQFNTCSIFDYPTKEQYTSKVDNMFEKMKAGNTRRKEGLTEIWDKTKTEQGKGVLIVEDEWEEQKSQRALILEAFSGDDVVGDFSKEKNAKVVSEAPQVKDYTLPGWGEWSGVGIAPNPRKRHWFTIKASPVVPRKDRSLPHIILSEKRNAALAQHQVAEVPYPFNTAADFEQSLYGPLSTTWIPSQAARLLNQPRVHTQMGAIIKPISAEEIFGDAGRHGH